MHHQMRRWLPLCCSACKPGTILSFSGYSHSWRWVERWRNTTINRSWGLVVGSQRAAAAKVLSSANGSEKEEEEGGGGVEVCSICAIDDAIGAGGPNSVCGRHCLCLLIGCPCLRGRRARCECIVQPRVLGFGKARSSSLLTTLTMTTKARDDESKDEAWDDPRCC